MGLISLGLPSVRRLGDVTPVGMPTEGPMVDTFGRVVTDLRVSLTDRCNLRCTYCMPAEGMAWLADEQLLSTDEMVRLLAIAVTRLGITSVRFTGGEPLLSKNLDEVVAATAQLRPRPEIALTTNGIGLDRRAEALALAGLDRVNVSLDSVDAAQFAAITRRNRLPDVLAGLAAASSAGLAPVKVNAVPNATMGRDDVVSLLRFCLAHGYQLRFIEQMPLDAGREWQRGMALSAGAVLTALHDHFTMWPDPAPRGSAPAQLWRVDGGPGLTGQVGIIASITRPFCSGCDRTRLTADGQVRNCLFSRDETDLRGLMRNGATDDDLEIAWRTTMWAKAAGHGINDLGFVQPDRPMSAIGG
ncbi:MAG: GTP 3',8-cyclase MoaA [Mycobacterium sp.]